MFYPTRGNKERTVNPRVRDAANSPLPIAKSDTTTDTNYLDWLRVAQPDVIEAAFNRSKLFALGRKNSGKEAVLSSLLDIDLREEAANVTQPVILGRYEAETFNRIEGHNTRKLTLEVWNYSWKAVYNYLQNLYMTECTLYLFVFDIKKVLSKDEAVYNEAFSYLKNILHSKMLQAPNSPVLLVGSNSQDLSEEDLSEASSLIFEQVLQTHKFGVTPFTSSLRFVPINTDNGDGIVKLKERIFKVLKDRDYVNDNVPRTIMQAEEILHDNQAPYISYTDVRKLFKKINVVDDDVCEILLKVLAERGIVTFLHSDERLRKFVVIDPAWLIKACGVAIYMDGVHKPLDYDINNDDICAAFNIFVYQRVLSKDLLCHVLARMNFAEEVHSYILNLMKVTCMVADYLFDSTESYLTPTFFDNLKGRDYVRRDIINAKDYKGPYFVLDFSGQHSNEIVNSGNDIFSTFMPFSFFEKLVSLSIQLSASFGQGIQPVTRYKKARLSFGAEVDFMFSVIDEEDHRPLKILVSTLTGTTQEKANDLLERILSMARGIQQDFYAGKAGRSKLALSLLVPAKDGSVESLTNYEEILIAKNSNASSVMQKFTTPGSRPVVDFEHWSRDGAALQVGGKVTYKPREADGAIPLKDGKDFHCFVSYNEATGGDVVQRQVADLKRLKFVCWLDKEYDGAVELSTEKYLEGVRKSECFILLLSAEVFNNKTIVLELATAIKNNIPIIFLHHPDTNKLGYWTFSQYITTCPSEYRNLFEEIESIPLQRRFYLQEAVTNQLVDKITEILQR